MNARLDCSDIINYERYPIDLADDPRRQAAVEKIRAELADGGCAVIREFFSAAGLAALVSEAEAPGMIGSKERVMNLYGKVTEKHDQRRVFADGLVD